MKASRIDVASAEHDLLEDEDGSMTDPDGVLRAVELFRQQQRQQQQTASGEPLTLRTARQHGCPKASCDCPPLTMCINQLQAHVDAPKGCMRTESNHGTQAHQLTLKHIHNVIICVRNRPLLLHSRCYNGNGYICWALAKPA